MRNKIYKSSNKHLDSNRTRFEQSAKIGYDRLFNFKDDESIYLLGFLWADGYLVKDRNVITLFIQKLDGECIRKIAESKLDCQAKIRETWRNGKRGKDQMHFRKGNFMICSKLEQLDFREKSLIAPNKILNLIPKNKHFLFWRGFFDGDGCIYSSKTSTNHMITIASSYNYDWSSLEIYCKNKNIEFKIRKQIGKTGKSSVIQIHKIDAIQRFFENIYPNKIYRSIGLKRKFDKLSLVKRSLYQIDRKSWLNLGTMI